MSLFVNKIKLQVFQAIQLKELMYLLVGFHPTLLALSNLKIFLSIVFYFYHAIHLKFQMIQFTFAFILNICAKMTQLLCLKNSKKLPIFQNIQVLNTKQLFKSLFLNGENLPKQNQCRITNMLDFYTLLRLTLFKMNFL